MAQFIKITTASAVRWVNVNDIHEIRESTVETEGESSKTYIGLNPTGRYIANETVAQIIAQVNSATTFF